MFICPTCQRMDVNMTVWVSSIVKGAFSPGRIALNTHKYIYLQETCQGCKFSYFSLISEFCIFYFVSRDFTINLDVEKWSSLLRNRLFHRT